MRDVEIIHIDFTDYTAAVVDLEIAKNGYAPYGKNNDRPAMLIDFSDYTPEHSAILELRQTLIGADGFMYNEENASVKQFLKDIRADETLEKVALDISVLETMALQIIYDKQTKPKVSFVSYLDSSKIRCAIVDDQGLIKGYYVSKDWSNETKYPGVFYPAFNPSKASEQPFQIFFWRKHALGQPYYPNVSYTSALNYIAMGKELSKFGLNMVKNGFYMGGILNYPSNASKEEKKKIKADLEASFQGSENAGKIIVAWMPSADMKVEFTPIATGDYASFVKTLDEIAIQKICTAHKCSPILASIDRQGASLGGDYNMILTALEVYNNTIIHKLQKPIIQIFSEILEHNGMMDHKLSISDNTLIKRRIADNIYGRIVKINEARKEGGLPPVDEKIGDKFIESDLSSVMSDVVG